MGYGYYILIDGREAGYNVQENCDSQGCVREVSRGLDNLCGILPDIPNTPSRPALAESGCKNYYCSEHKYKHSCTNPACDAYPALHYDLGGACILTEKHTGDHKTIDEDLFTETEEEEFERYDKELVQGSR